MILRLAAPYLAVGIFWCLFRNAWLTLLAYHAQILWWACDAHPQLAKPHSTPTPLLVVPFALAGPALAVLLPHVARTDVAAWQDRYHLTGPALLVMLAYFGLVHPVLEQIHWTPLRERAPFAHAAFAGYHLLVLWSLLPVAWLTVAFAVLWAASWLWKRMTRACGSLIPAVGAQAVADVGIVLAALLVASGRH